MEIIYISKQKKTINFYFTVVINDGFIFQNWKEMVTS